MDIPDLKAWKSETYVRPRAAQNLEEEIQIFLSDTDLDTASAYHNFFGKPLELVVTMFEINPFGCSEDLMFMPRLCFAYYIHSYMEYLRSPQAKGDSDAANCFFSLVKIRAEDFRKFCREPALDTLKILAAGQEWFDAPIDIYGSFPERAASCAELLNAKTATASAPTRDAPMSKRKKLDTASIDYRHFVEHPRYGREPRITGLNPVFHHWHSDQNGRVANTAIAANLSRQKPATIAMSHYFDQKRICVDCKRPFLFFAEEQKFWYEDLGFGLESQCMRCCDCRKIDQQHQAAHKRYLELCEKPERTTEEDLEWLEESCALYQAGRLGEKSKHKALHILNKLEKSPEINRARWEKCRRILKP